MSFYVMCSLRFFFPLVEDPNCVSGRLVSILFFFSFLCLGDVRTRQAVIESYVTRLCKLGGSWTTPLSPSVSSAITRTDAACARHQDPRPCPVFRSRSVGFPVQPRRKEREREEVAVPLIVHDGMGRGLVFAACSIDRLLRCH